MGASYSYVRKFAIARARSPAREARALPRVLEFGFIRVDAWLTAAKILQILIDESGNFLMLCVPRQADRLHAWSWRSSGLRLEPIFGQIIDEGRVLPCTRKRNDLCQFGFGFRTAQST